MSYVVRAEKDPKALSAEFDKVNERLASDGNKFRLTLTADGEVAVKPVKAAKPGAAKPAPKPAAETKPAPAPAEKKPDKKPVNPWASQGPARPEEAAARLDKIKTVDHPVLTDALKNPLPYLGEAERERVEDLMLFAKDSMSEADWKATRGKVPLAGLVTVQDAVSKASVRDKITSGPEPEGKKKPPYDLPVVVKMGKRYILADGNHRAAADLLLGKESMDCYLLDVSSLRR